MDILLWIVFGGIVGWLASLMMKTGAEQSTLLYVVVGVIGAVVGGWVMNYFGYGGTGGFNIYSFLVALLGAVILVWVVRLAR